MQRLRDVVESPYAIAALGHPTGQPSRRSKPPRPHRVAPRGSIITRPETAHRQVARRDVLLLTVRDILHTRGLYMEYLTYRGLGVVTAPEGEAGLTLARTFRPDVVIMDLAMAGLNGITATQRL